MRGWVLLLPSGAARAALPPLPSRVLPLPCQNTGETSGAARTALPSLPI